MSSLSPTRARTEEEMFLWPRTTPLPEHFKNQRVMTTVPGLDPDTLDTEVKAALESHDPTRMDEFERKWTVVCASQQYNNGTLRGELMRLREELAQHYVKYTADGGSSDDSDGFDPDYDTEWGENTNTVFGASRALSVDGVSDASVDAFLAVLRGIVATGTVLTTTERCMVWDGLREFHRHAQPFHHKHWLTCMTRLAVDPQYSDAPSVSNYVVVMREASTWDEKILTRWRQQKIRRWY